MDKIMQELKHRSSDLAITSRALSDLVRPSWWTLAFCRHFTKHGRFMMVYAAYAFWWSWDVMSHFRLALSLVFGERSAGTRIRQVVDSNSRRLVLATDVFSTKPLWCPAIALRLRWSFDYQKSDRYSLEPGFSSRLKTSTQTKSFTPPKTLLKDQTYWNTSIGPLFYDVLFYVNIVLNSEWSFGFHPWLWSVVSLFVWQC